MTAAAFDRVAKSYDDVWTNTAAGTAQRAQVWREVDGLFHAGERLLDVGCGTGVDAAHFADRGIAVDATDASPAMVQAARRRGGMHVSVLRAEDVGSMTGPYDGVISNFGALNCVADLAAVARGLARIVMPGGRVAICMIGKCCLWETLHYGLRGQWRKAVRRWRGSADSSFGTVRYPTIGQCAEAFAPYFELRRWTGIGVFVPPSYVGLSDRTVRALGAIDRVCAGLPLFRAMADHRLLILVRK